MTPPGDRPDESQEQRIRPVPRPVRSTPAPPFSPPPVIVPDPIRQAPPQDEASPARPDRARMDPLSLDRGAAKKVALAEGRALPPSSRPRSRDKRRQRLIRAVTLVLALGAGGILFWSLRKRLRTEASQVFNQPAAARTAVPSRQDRVLDMLEAFLTAPDMDAKAAWVLDRVRVRPLMKAAYASGQLPEDQLRFGVPLALEPGVSAVPAKVSVSPPFLMHLMVREEHGEPKLDWETYEQEITRKFITFAAKPGQPGGEFRLVLERTHDFSGTPGESVAVRVAAPGSPALAQPVVVRPDIAPALTDALPWNRRRRALVRLAWDTPPGGASPRMILREVVRWEFLP
jgi:hypothetical protein